MINLECSWKFITKGPIFWLHFSVFSLEKYLKNVKFSEFLPLKELLVTTVSETCALTSRTYVAEQDMGLPNLSEKLKNQKGYFRQKSLNVSKAKMEECDQKIYVFPINLECSCLFQLHIFCN